MSLRHAILALLTAEPMTGYDVSQHFDEAVAFLWSAPHSQIYPELRRMESDGLVEAEELPRGERATKRAYSLTEAGHDELRRWLGQEELYGPSRDVHRLKSAYLELGDWESARQLFQNHLAHYRRRRDQWREVLDAITSRRHPLLRLRLDKWPTSSHEVIVAAKAHAFEGEMARAEAEIAWAQKGLALVDRLELLEGTRKRSAS